MYLVNKYTAWYISIISQSKLRPTILGYAEKHHVIPKSLGGTNDHSNLVRLTAREHFICHSLLIRMTTGIDRRKMLHALGKFIQANQHQSRTFTSRQYDLIRRAISEARLGVKHTKETLAKMKANRPVGPAWNKGLKMKPISDDHKQSMSLLYTGKSFDERYGSERAAIIRARITASKLGKPSGMLGKVHPLKGTSGLRTMSDEGKKNVSEGRKGIKFSAEHIDNLTQINKLNGMKRRGMTYPVVTCPHCGKQGAGGSMTRYHFTNCKLNA